MPNKIPTLNDTVPVIARICQEIYGANGVISDKTKAPM